MVGNESEIFSSDPSSVGLTTSESILQSKPETVRKMVQATMQSVRYVTDEKNEEELVRLIQESWKLPRGASLGSLRSVRKVLNARGILSEAAIKDVLRLQRARYGL